MIIDRSAVMCAAHRLYRERKAAALRFNESSLALSWSEALRRAWAKARMQTKRKRVERELRIAA